MVKRHGFFSTAPDERELGIAPDVLGRILNTESC
jgi:hypothetical protein